jgi:hypothetical protein
VGTGVGVVAEQSEGAVIAAKQTMSRWRVALTFFMKELPFWTT